MAWCAAQTSHQWWVPLVLSSSDFLWIFFKAKQLFIIFTGCKRMFIVKHFASLQDKVRDMLLASLLVTSRCCLWGLWLQEASCISSTARVVVAWHSPWGQVTCVAEHGTAQQRPVMLRTTPVWISISSMCNGQSGGTPAGLMFTWLHNGPLLLPVAWRCLHAMLMKSLFCPFAFSLYALSALQVDWLS